ncbi:acyl-CoA dehydrogenase family protein [Streptomyces sp. NPDC053048]|uniref:acyl-CoA dehydrogenase family protein n=1 Tax=Streptomyces sp. NPDC053048 TaxID=3365694 RepID=UPI0037CF2C51
MDNVLSTQAPTREEWLGRASELVPVLRERAAWSEENRRLHDDSVAALAGAGVFRMRVPARYGGYECDTRTLAEVAAVIARGDGSAAWTAAVYWIPTWMASLFPDKVQDEVFATPDVRICGTLSPTAQAVPADGGVVLNGKWGFMSGAPHSHWQVVVAVRLEPGAQPMPVVGLVPMSDLRVVDDWHTSGLRGTGSVTTVAENVFVPEERLLPLPVVLEGRGGASKINADSPVYRPPLLPVAAASSVGTAVGLAAAARETFLEALPGRAITYTSYTSRREAPVTHLQVAEATFKADQAEFHAHRLTGLVDAKAADGSPWTPEERVRARADVGATARLAKESVDVLNAASGGSSIYSHVPIQRIARDVQALTQHALIQPDTNAELYGRVLCGLEPNTQYL